MKATTFKALKKANDFKSVYELVADNCTIADEFNSKQDYLDHLHKSYFGELHARIQDNVSVLPALDHAKQRACQMMGGTDKQMMAMYAL